MSFKTKIFFGIISIFLSSGIAAFGQAKIDWYESFCIQVKHFNPDSLSAAINASLDSASSALDRSGEMSALKQLGIFQATVIHDYEKSMDAFIRCLVLEDSLQLRGDQVITYVAIADVLRETSNFAKARDMLEQALEMNRPLADPYTLVKIQTRLGQITMLMGNLSLALEEFDVVLKYEDQVRGTSIEAEVLSNMAAIRTSQAKYNEALDLFKRSLAIRRALRDKPNEAICLNEIGNLYRRMKNDEKALANYVVALEIWTALNDKTGMATAFNNAGVTYYQQHNLQRAVSNLELALNAGRESQSQEQQGRSYEYLSLCFKEAGDFKKALEFKELHANILDFIQRDKDERKLVEAQNRYEVDKKETKIQQLETIRKTRERELASEKQFRDFLTVVIGLGVVVLLLTFYLYLIKRRSNKELTTANQIVVRQNAQLQDLNATKDKFFSIISHDLKGPLNSLTSFSGLLINHTDSLSKDEIKMLAKDLDKSLKNLFTLLENLLEWSRSQSGNIQFTPELFDIASLLKQNKELLTAQAQNKKITLHLSGEGSLMATAHRNSINTVVRNLLSNAIKFTPEGGSITLTCSHTENMLRVSVADTGVGMSEEVMKKLFRIDSKHSTKGTAEEKGTGLGLILCKEFVEKNQGRIWVESTVGKGSVFSFELPYAAQAVAAGA